VPESGAEAAREALAPPSGDATTAEGQAARDALAPEG
jgi:hypothetical protein